MDLTVISQKNSEITMSISPKEEQEVLEYIYSLSILTVQS